MVHCIAGPDSEHTHSQSHPLTITYFDLSASDYPCTSWPRRLTSIHQSSSTTSFVPFSLHPHLLQHVSLLYLWECVHPGHDHHVHEGMRVEGKTEGVWNGSNVRNRENMSFEEIEGGTRALWEREKGDACSPAELDWLQRIESVCVWGGGVLFMVMDLVNT